MKFRLALTLLSAAVLAFFISITNQNPSPPALPASAEKPAPVEEQLRGAIELPPSPEPQETEAPAPDLQLGPKLELSRGKLAWEAQIESVTTARDLSDTAKSRQLLAMIAALPEHGMTTAAEEAVRRLPDADYNSVALPHVANPETHGLVESVLFADLMARPDAIALPALLRIARIPNHPYAKYAHDNLDLLIGADFGADWSKWEVAVQKAVAAER